MLYNKRASRKFTVDLSGYDPDGPDWSPLSHRRWLSWRYVRKKDSKRPSKVPISVNGGAGSVSDPTTWGTRAQAEQRGGDGVGFVLGYVEEQGEYICGIDLDGCLDPDAKVTDETARHRAHAEQTNKPPSPSHVRLPDISICTDNTIPLSCPRGRGMRESFG